MRRPKSCCRRKCRRTCFCPQIQKSYSLAVYSSLRCWWRPTLRATLYCHWSLPSSSSSCCSRPCAYWSGCTYREYCGATADPCAIWNDRRLGYGHFRPGPQLGRQASGRHSSARGAAKFYASTHQYAARVFAAGGEYWRNGTIPKWGHLGARCNFFDEGFTGSQTLPAVSS